MHAQSRLHRRQLIGRGLAFAAAAPFSPLILKHSSAQDSGMNQPDGTYLFGSGEDFMPTVPVRWRIIAQTAKPEDEALALPRTLNFLVATGDQVIGVKNLDTFHSSASYTHVASSVFGAEGEVQVRWVPNDEEPGPYVVFELIVADQDDPDTIGSGTWLGSTDPFEAPQGAQLMEMAALVVSAVEDQQSKSLPDFGDNFPLIGYVHQQAINVVHADDTVDLVSDGETIVLQHGDIIEYAGDSVRDNASLYFARFVEQRSY